MCNTCDRPDVVAKGMCKSCYMRSRRNARRGYAVQRRPNGYNEDGLIAAPQDWQDRFAKFMRPMPSGCIEWTGAKTKGGYGVFTVVDVTVLAHRLSYRLMGNDNSQVVMHMCDNPSCCNPAHLIGGTYADNVADMDAKGRRVVSHANHLRDREAHPRAKPVVTPFGKFPSAALAADHCGVSARAIQKKCKECVEGYHYA